MIDARGRRSARDGKQDTVASHPNIQGVSLFEETPSTEGYKPLKSSGPAARESEVEKEKEVLRRYQWVVDLTPAVKTGTKLLSGSGF